MDQLENDSTKELFKQMKVIAQESNTFHKLAIFIKENYLKIIFMTAEETATQAQLSQGSVSRFCIAMGYRGFNNFLRAIQKLVSEEMTAPQRLQFSLSGNSL